MIKKTLIIDPTVIPRGRTQRVKSRTASLNFRIPKELRTKVEYEVKKLNRVRVDCGSTGHGVTTSDFMCLLISKYLDIRTAA